MTSHSCSTVAPPSTRLLTSDAQAHILLDAAQLVNLPTRFIQVFTSGGGVRSLLVSIILAVVPVAHGQAAPPAEDAEIVGPGHTAHWYVPESSGAGWTLEVLDETTALIYWFTYDESGDQRWLIGAGEIHRTSEGEWIEFPELYVTSGGSFGESFDPDDIDRQLVGNAQMWFSDCESGSFTYDAFGHQNTLHVQRLTRTMGPDCREPIHGHPLEPLTNDAGLTGSWYNPDQSGHGFSLQWLSRNEALIIWYTYGNDGQQQWLIGVGERREDQVVFSDIQVTSGGRFGADFESSDVEQHPWGMLALELDCESGVIAWDATESGFGTGTLELERLTRLERLACPFERPQLTDLYDVEISEIPFPEWSPGSLSYRATAIAEDGTVAGFHTGDRAWFWRPGEAEVELIDGDIPAFSTMLWRGASTELAAIRLEEDTQGNIEGVIPVQWTPGEAWADLPAFSLDSSILKGSSNNGRFLTGDGRLEDRAWVWDEEAGQRLLALSPSEDPEFEGHGEAVSNDGRVVAGVQTDFPGAGNFPRERATRWVQGEPELLQDQYGATLRWAFACNDDCSVILGGDQGANFSTDHPALGEAWAWSEEHGAIYFGRPEDADNWPNFAHSASDDASLVIGTYRRTLPLSRPVRSFIWTAKTGILSVTDLLRELGYPQGRWGAIRPADTTANGQKILIRTSERENGSIWRSWVIELSPKRLPHE